MRPMELCPAIVRAVCIMPSLYGNDHQINVHCLLEPHIPTVQCVSSNENDSYSSCDMVYLADIFKGSKFPQKNCHRILWFMKIIEISLPPFWTTSYHCKSIAQASVGFHVRSPRPYN